MTCALVFPSAENIPATTSSKQVGELNAATDGCLSRACGFVESAVQVEEPEEKLIFKI